MTKSIAFRQNQSDIWRGVTPEKYTRLLPHIEGDRIFEIGCAEGVLALLLAQEGKTVIGIDRHLERYEMALELKQHWAGMGRNVGGATFYNADIREILDRLLGADMLVAVRCIYYLKDGVDSVFAEIGKRVPRVLLCGNRGRAVRYKQHKGNPPDKLGKYNFLATTEGMVQTLERAGYKITKKITEGDPIVVGAR